MEIRVELIYAPNYNIPAILPISTKLTFALQPFVMETSVPNLMFTR